MAECAAAPTSGLQLINHHTHERMNAQFLVELLFLAMKDEPVSYELLLIFSSPTCLGWLVMVVDGTDEARILESY